MLHFLRHEYADTKGRREESAPSRSLVGGVIVVATRSGAENVELLVSVTIAPLLLLGGLVRDEKASEIPARWGLSERFTL
jgi:hypothetical protein